jgi:hypothetical protein
VEVDVVNGVKKLKRSTFDRKSPLWTPWVYVHMLTFCLANKEGFIVPHGSNYVGNQNQQNWSNLSGQTPSEFYKPIKATLGSLERARHHVRRQMNLIVQEVWYKATILPREHVWDL